MKFRWLLPFLLFFSVLLLYFSNKQTDHSVAIKKLETSLNDQIALDSLIIQRFINSEDDRTILTGLNKSPFFTEVFRNDSIIYWNDGTTIGNNPSDEIIDILHLKNTFYDAYLKLNLNSINVSNTLYNCETYNIKALRGENKQGYILINIQNAELGVYHETLSGHKVLKGFAWFLLFTIFIIMSVLLTQKIKNLMVSDSQIRTTAFVLLLVLVLFRIVHFIPAFYSLFDGFVGMKTLNRGSFVSENICSLLINLWIFGLFIYLSNLLRGKNAANLKSGIFPAIATGFYTFFIFGYSAHILEELVLIRDVNLEIEALLEFDAVSFILIICFSILMILIFQSTQMMYEILQKTYLKGISKYSFLACGWVLALILLWSLQWLNVPIWIFSLFIISYCLILDAYTETREQKITYLIWWLIMFSGYLAVSLFYFGLKKDIAARTNFIHQYFTQSNDTIVYALQQLSDSLASGDVFTRIASLDLPSRLDMNDLYQFIFKKPQDYKYSIELFDKKTGNTLFNNHFADYYKLNQSYINARKVGRNIVHNQIF